jgi:Cu-Zn family superoxide dismutase
VWKALVSGTVTFTQSYPGGPVTVVGNITGLPTGEHGFHVHTFGDLTDKCQSTGSHYNPRDVNHGFPDDKVRHVGDLGNIKGDENGDSVFEISDNLLQLSGRNSIIGRGVVVHANAVGLALFTHVILQPKHVQWMTG